MKKIIMGVLAMATGVAMARDAVFFVGAHPDDSEGFAATAFLLRDKYDIHVVDLTRGELGLDEAGWKDGSTARKRMAEEKDACAYLGATCHFLDEVDGFACAGRSSVDKLAGLIRQHKPVAVFTHWPVDNHCDHVQTAATTRNAVRVAEWKGEYYFFEVMMHQTRNFRPLYSVDVTKTIDNKCTMLGKYACQDCGGELQKAKRDQAALRGSERNPPCAYAEIFTTSDGSRLTNGVLEKLTETAVVR